MRLAAHHIRAGLPAQSDMRGKLIRAARLNGSCVRLMARRNSIFTLARMAFRTVKERA